MKVTCGNLQFILCRQRNDDKREAIALSKTYFLQLKAREALASLFFSASVLETLPVVGLLSICNKIGDKQHMVVNFDCGN